MLTINPSICTLCQRCVKVCPSEIFTGQGKELPLIDNIELCIRCGHCVAACDSSAITHEQFPPEKIHPIAFSKLPSPEQMLALIRKRRSNRAFSTKPVPVEYLSQIAEAAYRAPTASNKQFVEFTLVTDPEKLKLISKFTLDIFSARINTVDNAVVRPIFNKFFPELTKYFATFKEWKSVFEEKGEDLGVLRGATAVLFIHTPKSYHFITEDCQLAYQNASLMAESLGVSQFYTGFVLQAIKQKKGKLEKLLGINGKIMAGMALGIPLFQYPNYIDRKDIVLNWL